jgi:hypothetical protein
MATALLRSLPAARSAVDEDDGPDAMFGMAAAMGGGGGRVQVFQVPPYGARQTFMPRKPEHFGDGGAFPECAMAQYPLGIGKDDTPGTPDRRWRWALTVCMDHPGVSAVFVVLCAAPRTGSVSWGPVESEMAMVGLYGLPRALISSGRCECTAVGRRAVWCGWWGVGRAAAFQTLTLIVHVQAREAVERSCR